MQIKLNFYKPAQIYLLLSSVPSATMKDSFNNKF